jgi:hypothetical protein
MVHPDSPPIAMNPKEEQQYTNNDPDPVVSVVL